VFGPGSDEPLVQYEGTGTSTRRWFHADERGSVAAVSDASGDVVTAVNRYDEYGNVQGTLTGRFGYTGQAWLPEIGMAYYRARIYNPAMGRFMQTDPIGMNGGMNLYAYTGNNPVNFTDPMGLCNEDQVMLILPHYNAPSEPGAGNDGTVTAPPSICLSLGNTGGLPTSLEPEQEVVIIGPSEPKDISKQPRPNPPLNPRQRVLCISAMSLLAGALAADIVETPIFAWMALNSLRGAAAGAEGGPIGEAIGAIIGLMVGIATYQATQNSDLERKKSDVERLCRVVFR